MIPQAYPKVSIGVPVYNGQRYLETALDALLAQTYTDFELLIQDNASTDDTGNICRQYEQQDPRVKYVRNNVNVGAAENYNLVFRRSQGKYFKWAAHDDLCAPDFIAACVDVLDKDPTVVLCSGETQLVEEDGSPVQYDPKVKCYITKDGKRVGRIDPPNRAEGENPAGRYWDILVRTMRTFELFGLIRSDILRQTILHENYYGSDKVLLAELSLRGRFHIIPRVLFYRRCHSGQSSRLSGAEKGQWIGHRPQGSMMTRVRELIPAYVRVVHRAPLTMPQKLACYSAIAYRFVAPVTWHKAIQIGRYTDAPSV